MDNESTMKFKKTQLFGLPFVSAQKHEVMAELEKYVAVDQVRAIPTSEVFGLPFVSAQRHEVLAHLEKSLRLTSDSPTPLITVFTPNPEQIVQAKSDPHFFETLKKGDLLLPDGNGIVWASRILRGKTISGSTEKISPLPERIEGREVCRQLLEALPWGKFLLIGGRSYEGWYSSHHRKWPRLEWHHGYEDVRSPTEQEEKLLLEYLRKSRPAVVFVAFGAPYQEQWIIAHQQQLQEAGVKIAMVVGGSFDVLLGKIAQPPSWVVRLGLEWLYRLIQEPWRWKRQLRLIKFIGLTLQSLIINN
jgi:N-acetylglucosaminyldiphosphoundecaprenol N-acetyl-beta-D-mannosaminyltransferase